MAKKSVKTSTAAAAMTEPVARLRLLDKTRTDWAFSAEGFLLLYDPSVVDDEVWESLAGLQTIAAAALGWMTGSGNTSVPFVAEPQHWQALSRTEAADRLARLVRLGWERSLAMLPMTVAQNGADIRFRSTPLSADERATHAARDQPKHRRPQNEPKRAWITTRGARLGVTWDFLLGFIPAEKRKHFGPGYQVEIDWPAGPYQVSGYTFPVLETDDGQVNQLVLQLDACNGP